MHEFLCSLVSIGSGMEIGRATLEADTTSRFTLAGVNILTDFATAALPLPFLTQLPLPYQQKYAVMAVFALGGL